MNQPNDAGDTPLMQAVEVCQYHYGKNKFGD